MDRQTHPLYFILGVALAVLFLSPWLAVAEVQQIPSAQLGPQVFTNASSGHLRIDNFTPITYDANADEYKIPVVSVTPVTTVDPAKAAQGDATPQTIYVGKEIVATVPGTDMVKLADGTYTQYGTPSSTLADAASSASEPAPPEIGDLVTVYKVNENTRLGCTGEGYGTPVKMILTALPGSTYGNVFTASAYEYDTSMPARGYPGEPAFLRSTTAFAYVVGYDAATDTFTGASFNASCPPDQNGTVTYPGDPVLTSDGLGTALGPDLSDAGNNGLADDFDKACQSGSTCYFGDVSISQGDVDTFISTNSGSVGGVISDTISDGVTAGQTDGTTGTGEQLIQQGQLAGIQNTLNGIKGGTDLLDDIKENTEVNNTGYGTMEDVPESEHPTGFTGEQTGLITAEADQLIDGIKNDAAALVESIKGHYPFAAFGQLQTFIDDISGSPVAPVITFPVGFGQSVTLDFAVWDGVATVFRAMAASFLGVGIMLFLMKIWV